jgi:hypothetical protein
MNWLAERLAGVMHGMYPLIPIEKMWSKLKTCLRTAAKSLHRGDDLLGEDLDELLGFRIKFRGA